MTMTHREAQRIFQTARDKDAGKPIQNNTRLHRRGDGPGVRYAVKLHAVDVVTINADDTYTLQNGGWNTVTTLERIRGYSPAKLFSERGEWFLRLQPNPKDLHPARYDRAVPKPFEATDPGPEPVKNPDGCVAGQLVTTEHVNEVIEIWRKDAKDGDEFVELTESDSLKDGAYDRVKVKRTWNSHVWIGEKPQSWGDDGWDEFTGNQRGTGQHVINGDEIVKYVQCSHCKAFDNVHAVWDRRMNGTGWGEKFDQQSGYVTYRKMIDTYGSQEAWQEAYITDFRARRAYLKAEREWDQRNRIPFYDGITVDSDGYALRVRKDGPSPAKLRRHENAVKKMKARIDKYVTAYIAALKRGMPMPSGGDCWYCLMRTTEGETLGDASGDSGHLIEHMKDRYYVPSLAVNALREAGYKDVGVFMWLDMNPENNVMGKKDARYDGVKRDIVKYMRKRLVPAAPTK